MADSKITALTALTSADPANDMIPIVDVSDTPPASGNTKRISINNILAASGTATLASATITGDLTVDTNTLKVTASTDTVTVGATTTDAKFRVVDANYNGLRIGFLPGTFNYNLYDATTHEFRTAAVSPQSLYTFSASSAVWFDGAGGTRMTLNGTGLGIGGSPAAKLSVVGGNIRLDNNQGLEWGGANNYIYGSEATDFIALVTNGVEALRINNSQNVGIGVTPTTSRLLLKGNGTNVPVKIVGTTGDTGIPHLVIDKKDNDTTTSQLFIQFVVNDNGVGSGQINANGANQAAFGTYSDSRLKENIVSLPSQLANILSLRPVEFDYKDGSGHQIGFVAQEMQEVYSDAVGEQEGFLTVTGWSKTEARLVSAIKELAAKVQALEAKLA